jgi:hypothetical protein
MLRGRGSCSNLQRGERQTTGSPAVSDDESSLCDDDYCIALSSLEIEGLERCLLAARAGASNSQDFEFPLKK